MKIVHHLAFVIAGWIVLAPAARVCGQTPLKITCPANQIIWTCGTSAVSVPYPAPAVSNSCRFPAQVSCVPPSGSFFALGTSTVSCTATNPCGERDTCAFTVTVIRDTTPPSIQCPANIVMTVCGTNPVPISWPAPIASDNSPGSVTVTCTPASGSLFSMGSTPVTCTASDGCTNKTTCTFTVTVNGDATPPTIQCPTSMLVWTCNSVGAVVTYPTATASDNRDPSPTVSCNPASGSLFAPGTTIVTCEARDDCTNSSRCTFTVAVNVDTTPPVIQCPANTIVSVCGTNPVPISWPPPNASDNHSPVTVSCIPASGSLFFMGSTLVTCTATDDCTNRTTCTFTVTVNGDGTPPTIQCPADIVVFTCDPNGTQVQYPSPAANDDKDRNPTVVCVPPSGSVFPLGNTVVHCEASDDCTNRSSCNFTVTVNRDTTPPEFIICPSDVARFSCSSTGTVVNYGPAIVEDNFDPDPDWECEPPSLSVFPVGATLVTCTATDQCGNNSQCHFTVTVAHDTTPPKITCPPDIVVTACHPLGTVIDVDVDVDDDWDPHPNRHCEPSLGSVFPIGTTKVTCTATDKCGNSSQCSFKVHVLADVGLPGTDTNGDGLSDIWQVHFNAHDLAPGADTDGDGMTNAEEARAGTNPRDPGSSLRIDSIEPIEGGPHQFPTETIKMTYGAHASKLFQLQFTAKLGTPWADLGLPKRGSGVSVEFRIRLDDTNLPPTISTQAFFRLAVFDIDEDADRITAWEESIIGTSDLAPNTHDNPGGDHQAAMDWIAGNLGPARLREVDLAHIGGTPEIPTQTKLVAAVGTGGWIKLSSWTIQPATYDPIHLQDTPAFQGWNAKLHVLEPPITPTLTLNPFVSGRIGEDENLWLTVRRVDAAGAHSQFGTLGYGLNASLRVYDYAMAHRAITGSGITVQHYILITPVMGRNTGGQRELRVVTWKIDPAGVITALFDTGNLGHTKLPEDGGRLQIVPESPSRYVVSYLNKDLQLSSWFFDVNDAGVAIARGGATSGPDIRGKAMDPVGSSDFSLAGLNPAGFVTLLSDTNCAGRFAVWEDRLISCDAGCYSWPFFITDNTFDKNPNGNGILLDPPQITNSRERNFESNDYFGYALAVGDFDADGYQDVAIGVPGENDDAGAVAVMYGSADGLAGTGKDQHWMQGSDGLQGLAQGNDNFGYALAAGDFNGDGWDDLAIGAPQENIESESLLGVGVVHVLYGSSDGLTAAGDQLWMQGSDGLPGTRQDYDWFGWALAAGDFNGDGKKDLAIGIPREEVDSVIAGAVQIIYGSANGLNAAAGPGNQLLHQNSPEMIGEAQEFDFFGRSLAVGDFDGNGRDDLAVGIPRQHVNDATDAGAVQIIYGSNNGLGPDNHWFSQENFFPGGANIPGTQENYDQFGSALAAGDFNGDGRDDLAVGSPDEDDDITQVKDSGAVTVLYGTPTGLSPADSQLITQDGFLFNGPDIPGPPEPFDRFGRGLAAADFNGDGRADLAIGAAGEGVQGNTIAAAGVVHILYGGINGLADTGNQLYSQGTSDDDIRDQSEDQDWFGAALAAGDINGDGTNDLVIGILGESFDETTNEAKFNAGAIQVIHAGGSGLSQADEFEWQGTERKVRALLTDVQWEQTYGVGNGALFLRMPSGEPPTSHVASVTKVMTLLLAVEELVKANSPYHLDDPVTISALAADTKGSRMGLTTGYPPLAEDDVMPLELLLYGMMLESCNKSAVAIAQYFTGETEGYGIWTNRMNQRAAELGMTMTLYTTPPGGCITTPQDQVTLWRHAWQYQLFRDLVREKNYYNCGTDAQGLPKCYDVVKFGDSGYPGLDGWKSGNGGSGPQYGLPWCTEAAVRQATRLDRSMIVALSQTANKETDGDNLFDYGYRLLFTPDYRGGSGMNVPPITDFAVRKIHDTLGVTALIYGGDQLRLDTWQLVTGIGQVGYLNSTAITIQNLAPGTHAIRPASLDAVRLPSIEAQADYFTGHLEGTALRLNLWRILPEP